jgi:uncharacterized protein (TIGR02145 family)
MKTTTKQTLFFAVLCCIAASVEAQTVDVTLQCGQSYTINSTVSATAATGLTYRWLENGSPVTGTAANYTVPATKHAGTYTYIRQAKTTDCTDWQNSNAFTVAVINPDDGTCIAGITWAKYNVDVPGSFTTSPDDLGMLYKWDSLKYISPNETVTFWDESASTNTTWSSDQNPCPDGWRIPTVSNWSALFRSTKIRNEYIATCTGYNSTIVIYNGEHLSLLFGPGADENNPEILYNTVQLPVNLKAHPIKMHIGHNIGAYYWGSNTYLPVWMYANPDANRAYVTYENNNGKCCLNSAPPWQVGFVRCVK